MSTVDSGKSKDNFIVFIFSIIYVVFLFFFVFPKIRRFSGTFISPEEITYYDSIDREFILLKDETSFNKDSVGANINYEEGTRLGYGVIKAAKTSSIEYVEISKKLQEIERQLALLNSESVDFDRELRKNIIKESYSDAQNLIKGFYSKNTNEVSSSDIPALKKQQDDLRQKLIGLTGDIIWNPPGLISYSLDGFENFSTDYIYDMNKQTFEDLIKKPVQTAISGDFKIINNFKAIFAFYEPNNERIKSLNGRKISVSINGYKSFHEGTVIIPDNYDTEGIVGIKIDSHIEDIYKIRKGVISCIFEEQRALKIPNQSLYKVENEIGVLARDVNGIVVFRPVEILKKDGSLTIISSGDDSGFIGEGEERVRTLVYYEDVATDPEQDMIGKIYRR